MNADTTAGASGQERAHVSGRAPAHVVVVGGGIAGLAAAHRLVTAGVRVTLLEGGDRIGGKLLAGEIAGAPVDLGAESLLARRPEAVALARAVGIGDRLQPPATTTASVWSRGALVPMPKGHVMGVPADGETVGGLLSDEGVRRVGQDRELPPTEIGDDIAIGAYVADRMGREVVDRLVEPLLGGVYAGDAYRISLRAAVPKLFDAARTHPTLSAAVRAVQQAGAATPADAAGTATGLGGSAFMGIDGGVGTLPGAVADAIRAAGGEILVHAPVTELRRLAPHDGGASRTPWQVVTPGRTFHADGVVVATPAWSAAELLADEAPAASAELGAVEYASMALITLAFRRADIQGLPGSGFLVPPVDGHTIKASTFSSQKWRWVADAAPDLFVLRTSVGRYGEEEQIHRDDADLVEASLKDLGAAAGLTARPVATTVTRWIGGLPQYPVGHLGRVARIREAVAELPGLRLAGAVYDGVGIPACIASGHRAADEITEEITEEITSGITEEIADEIADEIIATSKTVDPGAGHCP
ncbi:protoporphyrinogen oxidase [Streptomyces sp. ISL-36]|uniref:protoporphyrinogen oxidase n=1 Tax=Streptomyces sp. ISL-36 TaxID=2819182 RepID=UPI001BED2D5B|nr:protoporphyrinogen oxidase [Streptomyces sp. ISL-36]MBT2440009.1 protoporphyrinogen oxidase [Streptomyces sp. ISL-36]